MQIFVYGDSFQSYLVAVVVPDAEEVAPWAKALGLAAGSTIAQILEGPQGEKLKSDIHAQLTAASKAAASSAARSSGSSLASTG